MSQLLISYSGIINEDALRNSFIALCDHHPILRSSVYEDGSGFLLSVPSDGSYPEFVAMDGDLSTCLRKSRDLAENLSSSLAYLLLVRGNNNGHVVFGIYHSIADGAASFAYISELWNLYTRTLEGGKVTPVGTPSLPESSVDLLKQRSNTHKYPTTLEERRTALGRDRAAARADDLYKIDGKNVNGLFEARGELLCLDHKETSNLIRATRHHGVTIGTIITGALTTALRNHASAKSQISMRVATGVDLRKHVAPPLAPTEIMQLVAGMTVTIPVPADANPVTIAREFKTKLESRIKDPQGGLLPVAFPSDQLRDRNAAKRMREQSDACFVDSGLDEYCITLNNWGRIPEFPTPAELHLTEFGLTGFYEDSTARSELRTPTPYMLIVYSFGGELRVYWIEHKLSENEVKEEFMNLLRHAGEKG